MITIIKSTELKTDADLVCGCCGMEHDTRKPNGDLVAVEGKDFVFETDGIDEWCMCVECSDKYK